VGCYLGDTMTLRLAVAAALTLLVGCQRVLASSDQVVMPDGMHGWTITCGRVDHCYQLAGQDCPNGYRIVDNSAQGETSASYLSTLGSTTARYKSGQLTTLLIECRDSDRAVADPAPRRTAPTASSRPASLVTAEPHAKTDGGGSIETTPPF
jgi:hypothetical protein